MRALNIASAPASRRAQVVASSQIERRDRGRGCRLQRTAHDTLPSPTQIYHSRRSRAWSRIRVCQRRWELWSPLLLRWPRQEEGCPPHPAASLLHPFCFAPDQPPWCEAENDDDGFCLQRRRDHYGYIPDRMLFGRGGLAAICRC